MNLSYRISFKLLKLIVFLITCYNLAYSQVKENPSYTSDFNYSPEQNEILDSLSIKLSIENTDTSRIKLLNEISWHLAASDIEKSILFADSAITLSEKCNWLAGKADALNNKGEALRIRGSFEEALAEHKSALNIFQEINLPTGIAKTESNIGIAYFNLADFSSAFKHFDNALDIYKYLNDQDGIVDATGYIGVVFSNFEQHEKAIEYFEKSLKIAQRLDEKSKIAIQMNNIALAYVDLKRYSEAVVYYKRAMEIFKELGEAFNYSLALGNIGIPYVGLREYSKAIESFNEALKMAVELDDQYGIAHQYGNLGELYLKMEKDDKININENYSAKAIKHLKLSIKEFDKLGTIEDQKVYLLMLSEVYEISKNYKKSLIAFKYAKSLQDSIQAKENQKVIAGLEIKQELYNKEQEIIILNQERDYDAMIKTVITVGAVLLAIIAIVIFSFYKKKRNDNVLLQKNIRLREKVENSLRLNEMELTKHKNHLEKLVRDRTKKLEIEILEHKETEEALLSAIERTEIANNAKTVFLANMSHELRTPLVGILGYSDLLTTIVEDDDAKEMAEGINRTGNRLLNTLSLILDLARIESDKFEIEISQVDVSKELNETYMNFRGIAKKKNLKLTLDLHTDHFTHSTDLSMLKVILDNLVNNAIKFTKKGEINIVSDIDYVNGEHNLIIKVIDSGVGIRKKDIPLIFEEFKQLSEGLTKDFQGSGLGLSITKKFVNLLGGEISVKSEPGIGSTFTICFPTHVKAVA